MNSCCGTKFTKGKEVSRKWYRFETRSTGTDLVDRLKNRHYMPLYLINEVICK